MESKGRYMLGPDVFSGDRRCMDMMLRPRRNLPEKPATACLNGVAVVSNQERRKAREMQRRKQER